MAPKVLGQFHRLLCGIYPAVDSKEEGVRIDVSAEHLCLLRALHTSMQPWSKDHVSGLLVENLKPRQSRSNLLCITQLVRDGAGSYFSNFHSNTQLPHKLSQFPGILPI